MAELEKLEYPKPNREFIYDTFNAFAKLHPWVAAENIRPKSIAREMFENLLSFTDYVKEYGLERGEGLVLRYLSEMYKTLVQSVPLSARNEAVDDVVTYFGAIVRSVDSSLLDEWERLREGADVRRGAEPSAPPIDENDVTRDPKAFTVLVRNALFGIVRALSRRDYVAASAMVTAGDVARTPRELDQAMVPFFSEHAVLRTDPAARSPANTRIERREGSWRVEQILCDNDDANDFRLLVDIDLAASREAGAPVIAVVEIGT
jgi:hypothetical protein